MEKITSERKRNDMVCNQRFTIIDPVYDLHRIGVIRRKDAACKQMGEGTQWDIDRKRRIFQVVS